MAGNDHPEETYEHPDNPEDLDIPEDPLLAESLKNLSKVYVPSEFLPNVMFRVYEKHHREKISLPQVATIALVLLVLSVGLLVWDVMDIQAAENLPGFSTAWAQKMDLILIDSADLLNAASGILTAAWQIVTGMASMFFATTPWYLQLLLPAAMIGLGILGKKWLSK